ncbi:C40 family peptidase [Iodobacter ciconiae]|uniref:Peptidoglycan endopeptidase n=1 Tax=Iodobacter ciconiae TaxID=2496266 RepID=A0A3S8ZSE1_9NEIS|nr:C40 family peptidase [Iodobacter ciconiae]AZN36331.1 peptidoglycan endopeptidase [Iodobacter ciconiae]
MDKIEIASATMTERTDKSGKECTIGRFIDEKEGWKVVNAAEGWEGTIYKLIGAASQKGIAGDCSGSTYFIYKEAGFPYVYQTTSTFIDYANKTHRFREIKLAADETPQAGDVLWWSGHMAIYAPFPEGHPKQKFEVPGSKAVNDMYTAFNSRTGHPYGPFNIKKFRKDPFKVFRYYIISKDDKC